MLEALRARLDMDVAFVSRQLGTTHRIFTHVAARGRAPLISGDHNANDNSLCWLVIQGKLPERVNDVSLYENAACLPVVDQLNVRSHFSVPLYRRDGRVHGSLCCFSYRPRPDIGEHDMRIIRSVAAIVSDQIEGRIELEERSEEAGREITRLMADDDIAIIHQPIYDLTDWHLIGFECLMRQKANPIRSPLDVLERAREAGKTLELEVHIARTALATLDPAHPERFIAINVSPTTLVSDDLAALIPEGLESRLVIELNQYEAVLQQAALKQAIQAWKARAWVAVNSVGASFASLQALLDLEPDIVKIDRDLLGGLASDPNRRALVKALVQFAAETGITLIAQGVETREDLQALHELGVRFAQGYILGKPKRQGHRAMMC
jgi:EAL domain-containing protein (putative c-di-GMP-specific phosphodiesterase class I)